MVLLAALSSCTGEAGDGPPRLTVLGEPHQRIGGLLKAGEVYARSFEVHNGTAHTIEVVELTRSCGCTETTLAPTTLKPGADGRLDVLVDTIGKTGAIEARVELLDPQSRVLATVSVSAVVEEVPSLLVDPAGLELPSSAISTDPSAGVVRVILERQAGYADTVPAVLEAYSEDGIASVSQWNGPELVSTTAGETWTWLAHVSAVGGDVVDDVLRIRVYDGRQPREARLTVHRSGDSWLACDVRSFFAGVLQTNVEWATTAPVSRLSCLPSTIRVETTAAWLRADLLETGEPGRYELRVSGTPPKEAVGELSETIRLTSDAGPEISFSVRGVVR